jgi:hypothetical protein
VRSAVHRRWTRGISSYPRRECLFSGLRPKGRELHSPHAGTRHRGGDWRAARLAYRRLTVTEDEVIAEMESEMSRADVPPRSTRAAVRS